MTPARAYHTSNSNADSNSLYTIREVIFTASEPTYRILIDKIQVPKYSSSGECVLTNVNSSFHPIILFISHWTGMLKTYHINNVSTVGHFCYII